MGVGTTTINWAEFALCNKAKIGSRKGKLSNCITLRSASVVSIYRVYFIFCVLQGYIKQKRYFKCWQKFPCDTLFRFCSTLVLQEKRSLFGNEQNARNIVPEFSEKTPREFNRKIGFWRLFFLVQINAPGRLIRKKILTVETNLNFVLAFIWLTKILLFIL